MKKLIFIGIIAVSCVGYIGFASYRASANSYTAPMATSTPTRLERTEKLINDLTSEREKDISFTTETQKQIADLMARRHIDARMDALKVIKTQYDVEYSDVGAEITKVYK